MKQSEHETRWVPLAPCVIERFAIERHSVMVHSALWAKIRRKHPESYSAAEIHLESTIREPHYMGQAPQHFENIELIRRTPAGPLLVAIKIYNTQGFQVRPLVASAYLVTQQKLVTRLHHGTVIRVRETST